MARHRNNEGNIATECKIRSLSMAHLRTSLKRAVYLVINRQRIVIRSVWSPQNLVSVLILAVFERKQNLMGCKYIRVFVNYLAISLSNQRCRWIISSVTSTAIIASI